MLQPEQTGSTASAYDGPPEDDAGDPAAGLADEAADGDGPTEEAAPEGPVEPADATDLDDLISSIALDPTDTGDKGEDLFDDLREVRNAADDERGEKARELIEEIAEWVADDEELDAPVGQRAIELLEPLARPDHGELAEASALFAEVATDKAEWGENAEDLLSDRREVLDADDRDDVADKATDLAEEVEEWREGGEIDAELAARVRNVLRPLSGPVRSSRSTGRGRAPR